MSRRFFGSDFNADYFEGYLKSNGSEGSGQKDMVAFGSNLPAVPQMPLITGGRIEITDYRFGLPIKKRKVKWVNVNAGGSEMHYTDLDVYARIIRIMKENGIS